MTDHIRTIKFSLKICNNINCNAIFTTNAVPISIPKAFRFEFYSDFILVTLNLNFNPTL